MLVLLKQALLKLALHLQVLQKPALLRLAPPQKQVFRMTELQLQSSQWLLPKRFLPSHPLHPLVKLLLKVWHLFQLVLKKLQLLFKQGLTSLTLLPLPLIARLRQQPRSMRLFHLLT